MRQLDVVDEDAKRRRTSQVGHRLLLVDEGLPVLDPHLSWLLRVHAPPPLPLDQDRVLPLRVHLAVPADLD